MFYLNADIDYAKLVHKKEMDLKKSISFLLDRGRTTVIVSFVVNIALGWLVPWV